LFKSVLSFFLPQACLSCRSVLAFGEEGPFCPPCEGSLKRISKASCTVCGDPFPHEEIASHVCGRCLCDPPPFRWARSVFALDEVVSRVIHGFKYGGNEAAVPWFTSEIVRSLREREEEEEIDVVTAVPLHPFRLLRRGYNQSLLIARETARRLEVPLDSKSLKRRHFEKPQVERSREERLKRIRGAFVVKAPAAFEGKRVLLIDDVYTTGATLRECAKVLAKAGAEVTAFTVARTPLHGPPV
jgi:ComF family protein